MDCNISENKSNCNCTYEPCPRKGKCCDCISFHQRNRELPACVFSAAAERTYDRSYSHFARLVGQNKV